MPVPIEYPYPCAQFIANQARALFILVSGLYEGGNQAALVKKLTEMQESGVKVICLLAISDRGVPSFDENLARRISQTGAPCFACTPGLLPELI